MVYLPREDSYLLKAWVEQFAKGFVLDIGTGTGIQAIAAAKKAEKVIAVDIDPNALEYAKNQCEVLEVSNVEFRQGNLFDSVKKEEKFDLIIFNPPYLPEDGYKPDPSTIGGPTGREVIISFLQQAKKYLRTNGRILILFSSLTGKEKVLSLAKKEGYKAELLQKKHFNFEDLFVYSLSV